MPTHFKMKPLESILILNIKSLSDKFKYQLQDFHLLNTLPTTSLLFWVFNTLFWQTYNKGFRKKIKQGHFFPLKLKGAIPQENQGSRALFWQMYFFPIFISFKVIHTLYFSDNTQM